MRPRILIFVILILVLSGCFNDKKEEAKVDEQDQLINKDSSQQEDKNSKGDSASESVEEVIVGKDNQSESHSESVESNSTQNTGGQQKKDTSEGNIAEKKSDSNKQKLPQSDSNSKPKPDDSNSKPIAITEEQIMQKYKQELLGLQSYYSAKLSGLASASINELKATSDKQEVYSKYLGIGMALKDESEAAVNQTLYEMEKELKVNSLSTNSVSELRQTYYSVLTSARNNAFNQIRAELGI
jgi:FtsZ-interacting cell division protein ZipA